MFWVGDFFQSKQRSSFSQLHRRQKSAESKTVQKKERKKEGRKQRTFFIEQKVNLFCDILKKQTVNLKVTHFP
jgi:hypothetical protein